MIKALAIKELREAAGVVCLAALGMVWIVLTCMGKNPLAFLNSRSYDTNHIAFVGDGFYYWSAIFVGALAVILGFKQSAWEVQHSTFYFLFHRPISRRLVLAIKILVGTSLVVTVLALAILVYGSWAAVPGHLAAPFEWSMTFEAIILALALPLIYLGAFLSGIRPGKWFGTRLVPLVGAVMLVTTACMLPFWWLRGPILLLGYGAWLVATDYYTQTRDY